MPFRCTRGLRRSSHIDALAASAGFAVSGAATVQSFGTYQVIRKLGAGGMAEVFLAMQRMSPGVERRVVIKAMLPHLVEDQDFVRMFMREARIASMLQHPNIVQIIDVQALENRPCIIMECLRGRDLWFVGKRLRKARARLSPMVAAAIGCQVAAGLDYAHRIESSSGELLGLVHRDVSPHNLFLTREGHVRLLDFGIAKINDGQHRTQAGALKGKLPYMAPEQARGHDLDGRADQFSLGVILWESLTGHRLFKRDDPLGTMNALFFDPIVPPSAHAPSVPASLDAIVIRMLERDRDKRFSNCGDVADALRQCMREENAKGEQYLVRRLLERTVPLEEDDVYYDVAAEDGRTAVSQVPPGIEEALREPGSEVRAIEPEAEDSSERRSRGRRRVLWWSLSAAALAALGALAAVYQPWRMVLPHAADTALAHDSPEAAAEPLQLPGIESSDDVALPATQEAAHLEARQPEALQAEARPSNPIARKARLTLNGVPDDVQLQFEGAALVRRSVDVAVRDAPYVLIALREGKEIWQWKGVIESDLTIVFPKLKELSQIATNTDEKRPTRRRARRASTSTTDTANPGSSPAAAPEQTKHEKELGRAASRSGEGSRLGLDLDYP